MQHTGDKEFMQNITRNAKRYGELFAEAIDDLMPVRDFPEEKTDIHDILHKSREAMNEESKDGDMGAPDKANKLPKELTRRYEVYFKPTSKFHQPTSLRDVKASNIGQLVTIKV